MKHPKARNGINGQHDLFSDDRLRAEPALAKQLGFKPTGNAKKERVRCGVPTHVGLHGPKNVRTINDVVFCEFKDKNGVAHYTAVNRKTGAKTEANYYSVKSKKLAEVFRPYFEVLGRGDLPKRKRKPRETMGRRRKNSL